MTMCSRSSRLDRQPRNILEDMEKGNGKNSCKIFQQRVEKNEPVFEDTTGSDHPI